MISRRFLVLLFLLISAPAHAQLDEHCTISILNRTARVKADGSWRIDNVPANFGRVRARATCTEDGVTRSGQSGFLTIQRNQLTGFESHIPLTVVDPIPASLTLTTPLTTLPAVGATTQLTVTARFPDGSTRDVTTGSSGTNYTISNRAVATVSPDGLVTAVASGMVILSALHDGALGLLRLQVASTSGDTDGDGIPDDVEVANGLNPNDPADATQDPDGDSLTNKQELVDYNTNPQVADTDGDGVRDGLEIQTGSDPLDPASINLAQALTGLEVTPASGVMILNTILGEAAQQLTVSGRLRDGTTMSLTATARGTTYTTSDPVICTLDTESGRIAAGTDGTCAITATNSGFTATATITVRTFAPTALGMVAIPGYANNVDVRDEYAYVAAGAAGLQVVDASNPSTPVIVGTLDTPGNANDVRVRGNLVYIAAGSQGLQIIDVTVPSVPVLVGAVDTPGTAQDVTLLNGWAYIADGEGGVQVIDVSVPSLPRLAGHVLTPGAATGVAVAGSLLVVTKENSANSTATVEVIDILDPATPQVVGRLELGGGQARDVSLQGTFAYIAAGPSRGFHVVDVAVPSRPRLLSSLPSNVGFAGRDVEQVGQFVGAADAFGTTAALVDVSDASAPQFRALIDFSNLESGYDGIGIAQDDRRVYLTASTSREENGTTGNSRLFIGQYLDFPADTAGVAPKVRITEPPAGAVVREGELLTVLIDAIDDVAVPAVELLVNGQVVATGTRLFTIDIPFQIAAFTLSARAVDPGGNRSVASDVTVAVEPDPLPTVAITTPTGGATMVAGDSLLVTVAATDDRGIVSVRFLVDGVVVFIDTLVPYRFVIPVPVGSSSLTLGAVAVDGLGQTGIAANVQISVIPDPLTSANGRVADREGNPVAGVTVRCGDQSSMTAADGSFVVTGLSTISGPVQCVVSMVIGEDRLVGVSLGVSPVRGGTTVLPEMALTLGGRGPLYPGQKLLVDGGVWGVAAADFNGDGAPDLVAANGNAPEVSLFLGNGDATFQPPQRVATEGPSTHVVAVDLNHDGALDVVTANYQSTDLAVMLGNGDGTFQPVRRFAVGANPAMVKAEDLDLDGHQDLIAINQGASNNISILRGNGDGTFQAQQHMTVFGAALSAVAVADVDLDGLMDILVTDTIFDSVWLFLGNGDGTFQEQLRVAVGTDPVALAVGDLNGDRKPDVVVANATSADVSLLLGRGDGTFVAQPRVAVGEVPTAVTVADVDGDRIEDVLTTTQSDVSVWLGLGDGTFAAQQRFAVGGDPVSIVVGDWNLDSLLDVATGTATSRAVSVLLGVGDGSLVAGLSLPAPSVPTTVLTTELNSDVQPDLVMTTETGTLLTRLGTGGRTFGPTQTVTVGAPVITVAAGDLNGDGVIDLVALTPNVSPVAVLRGNGDGTFQPSRFLATSGGFLVMAVDTTDVNNDGKLDISVLAMVFLNGMSVPRAAVFLGIGDGTFQPARLSPFPGRYTPGIFLEVADLTGDGVKDMVFPDPSLRQLLVLRGVGDGTFVESTRITLEKEVRGIMVGDVNGDSRADVIVTQPDGDGPDTDELAVFLGIGGGQFGAPVRVSVGDGPTAVASGDVDVDGHLDIVVMNQSSRDVSVLRGRGDGTFAEEERFDGGFASQSLSLADFDRDGGLDIVVTKNPFSGSSGVTILFRR